MIKTAVRNSEAVKMKKIGLIKQIKAKVQKEKSQPSMKQPDHEREDGYLIKMQNENRELRKRNKKLESSISEQAQKLQTVKAKSGRLETENKSLRTSLYEANTGLIKEKKLGVEKQMHIEQLIQKLKVLEDTKNEELLLIEKLKRELSKAQALANTNTEGYRKLHVSMSQLQKLNQELSRKLQREKEMRGDQDQVTHFKQTVRTQAAYIQELKRSQSKLISEASVQGLYDAIREKLVLAKPSHKKMLLDLFNRLKRIKGRFLDASRPDQYVNSKELYGYVIRSGEEFHFYNLDNGVFRVQSGDKMFESDLPVKAQMIHEHEVSIVKQYTYHYVPKAANAVRRRYKRQSAESAVVPTNSISKGIKVLIVGSQNRAAYTRILTDFGFNIV